MSTQKVNMLLVLNKYFCNLFCTNVHYGQFEVPIIAGHFLLDRILQQAGNWFGDEGSVGHPCPNCPHVVRLLYKSKDPREEFKYSCRNLTLFSGSEIFGVCHLRRVSL